MTQLLLITDEPVLRDVFQRCTAALGAALSTTASWADARDKLFKNRYDALFIDYEAMKIEGLDAFILLDNVLQKEQTPGALILRKDSRRARQFLDSLASFSTALQLDGMAPSVELLRAPIERALQKGEQPAPSVTKAPDTDLPVRVQVHLSTRPAGTFDQVDLARALYTLALLKTSGYLALAHGALKHRYAFWQGRLLSKQQGRTATLDTLARAFAWTQGEFKFTPAEFPEAPTEEPLSFIYRGLGRYRPARLTMQALMPQMKRYPTPTDLWESRRETLSSLSLLEKLMQACDGNTTLERAIATLGAQATDGFYAAYFATQTDLLMLRSDPTPQGILVEYNREVVKIQQQQVDAQRKSTKAWRAAGTDRLNLERELADFLARIERSTPYEIFDVWEGCGRELIQNKFYDLVKSHHPDVYGGNISGDVKRLAQEIFIAIKDAYQALLKVEREQTVPDPAQPSALGDEPSFAARPATRHQRQVERPNSSEDTGADDARARARQSQIDRLRAKRSATPIGLAREPSAPLTRRQTLPGMPVPHPPSAPSKKDRLAKIARIRSRSNPGMSSTTGQLDPEETAQKAFNEGYTAWRENENIKLAAERFATAYNLQPNNAKYMTFYGYFLFLRDPNMREDAQRILEKAIELKDRQSLPDAYLFMGHLLKVQEKHREALKAYQHALKLNPVSRDAQREIRLYERRNKSAAQEDSASFFRNLFKK